ncbi:hypothetical protein D3C78_1453910 [compost metagenome]
MEQGVDEIEDAEGSAILHVDPELGSAKGLPELFDEPAHEHGEYAELDVSEGADEAACWEADLIEGGEEAYHYVEPEPEPNYDLELDPNGRQMF